MLPAEFSQYRQAAIEQFALEKIRVGTWIQTTAKKLAENEFNILLPQGCATPVNYLFKIVVENKIVGNFWLAKSANSSKTAFIYDFEILPEFQNQGLGTKALDLGCKFAQQQGFSKIELHVFGGNQRALHVYQKAGFSMTDIVMQRKLEF